jgi:hypothetical protein
VRGRGLKRRIKLWIRSRDTVAPRVGAWIEDLDATPFVTEPNAWKLGMDPAED